MEVVGFTLTCVVMLFCLGSVMQSYVAATLSTREPQTQRIRAHNR